MWCWYRSGPLAHAEPVELPQRRETVFDGVPASMPISAAILPACMNAADVVGGEKAISSDSGWRRACS